MSTEIEKKEPLFSKMQVDEYGTARFSVIEDDQIKTVRLTPSEHKRIMERAEKEYQARSNTLWNRLALAFTIVIKG
jgi:hypothetical protein